MEVGEVRGEKTVVFVKMHACFFPARPPFSLLCTDREPGTGFTLNEFISFLLLFLRSFMSFVKL